MSYGTATRNADDVVKYIKRQFGDESGVQITSEDIVRWINVAQAEIILRNKPIKAIYTTNLVANQSQYTFPNDILEVERVRVNGSTVDNMSFQEADVYINDIDSQSMTTNPQPQFWYEYGGVFMLWPKPSVSVTNGIEVFHVPMSKNIITATSTLTVPDIYFNRLIEHVMAQAYELDENFEASASKSRQFDDGMTTQTDEDSSEPSTYSRITLLPEDM